MSAPLVAESLQRRYAPRSICFGCGPANEQGLRIESRVEGDEVVCTWTPQLHHRAFPGMLNGGIAGALLDCHSNWTAAWFLMQARGEETPPCTVTADFHVKLRWPTPVDGPLFLRAKVVESGRSRASSPEDPPDRAVVEATLEAAGKITVTCRGTFVAVREGHPAYHAWN